MKILRTLIITLAAVACSMTSIVQERNIRLELNENRNRLGGSSSPYEYIQMEYSRAPKGYEPFYISHFGRHGSRMHTSADMLNHLNTVFNRADSLQILTPDGMLAKELFTKTDSAMRDHLGELTYVGQREQEELAERMSANFPEVFSGATKKILAQSTTSDRVVKSMNYFCKKLLTLNGELDITEESNEKTQRYLNNYTAEYREYYKNGPWREVRDTWIEKNIDISSLTGMLFTSAEIFNGKPNGSSAKRFAQDLYSLAKIMPASGLGYGFYDFFTEDELYALWQSGNMDQYMRKSGSPLSEGLATAIAKPLLKDFLEKAVQQISEQDRCADLRFGHGEGMMPLSALMQIEEASAITSDPDQICEIWQDYRVTTMSSNIQWIFYKNKKDDILVKIMLNEREARIPVDTDIWPYYHWSDVYAFYQGIL